MTRIIRQISVIGLFVLAVAVGVNAQANQQYRANVPFSFEANGKQYEAGQYKLGPMTQVTAPSGIAITNVRSGHARVLGLISQQGDSNWDKPGQLTFIRQGGRYTLSHISTATFRMKMKAPKAQEGDLAVAEVVAVDLKR